MTNNEQKLEDFEELATLAPLVRQGDTVAYKRMIEGYMPLVHSRVNVYLQLFPNIFYLRDDMISEGYLSLVRAVSYIAESDVPKKDNPTSYILTTIIKGIGNYIQSEGTVKIPKHIEDKASVLPPVFNNLNENISNEKHKNLIEIRDILEHACQSDLDREIVRLREARYTDHEIAIQLDLPIPTIYMHRHEIYDRYKRLQNRSY